MKDLVNKIDKSGGTGLSGSKPDESTYSRWSHLLSPSQNALQSTEELMFFSAVLIVFFAIAFAIIYNILHLVRVLRNIDGSLYQTKHIAWKVLLIIGMLALEYFILNYILVVAKII